MKLIKAINILRGELTRNDIGNSIEYGYRVWTRGDGFRYKEENKIFGLNKEDLPKIWECIQNLYPRAKKIQVKGEFGSDPYCNALIANGVVYVYRTPYYIHFASKSILRNDVIWNRKPGWAEPPREGQIKINVV